MLPNREQRRYLASVLRSRLDSQPFLVTEGTYRFGRRAGRPETGIQIRFHCADEWCDVSWLSLDDLAMLLNQQSSGSDLPVPVELADAEHTWAWSTDRDAFYALVDGCEECGGVHIPLLDDEQMLAILARTPSP